MRNNDRCLELDRQRCFPMYVASKEILRKYTPYLDELGITYTQYIVMLVLWGEEKISMRDLSKRVYLDSGTLTPLLDKLERKGLIERSRNKNDIRTVDIAITAKGVWLKVQAREIPKKIGKCLALSPREAYELSKILKKILKKTGE